MVLRIGRRSTATATMARCKLHIAFFSMVVLVVCSLAEHVRDLEISEGAPIGTRIGFIGDNDSDSPPYLIVPVGSSVDSDLNIDQNTGEIRSKVVLDREVRASYSLVAIPMSGDNIKVNVKVLDENDNAPTFPMAVMSIEFPENTPRDVKRTLLPAKDLDLDQYNTQKYNIVSGNINNAFRLSSHRERDGVLYLDMQINGFLDRETTSAYSLVIEALDGGSPPLRGEMTVNITIQDVNDNQPIFNQSRYFATVPENATIGTTVCQVVATDIDAGDNGMIEYFINRRQSDKDELFKIDPSSGIVSVNKPLDFETKELHELVVVARDRGLQPLETTAFVSIKVTDVNDNQPTINVIFLSDDATPKISESAQPGEFVARISVNDPDSKTEYSNINVTLTGGEGHFGLTTRDNIIYLVIVSLPLDRELQPNYTLNVVATDTGTPPLHATRTINLKVTDINDNSPEFTKEVYHANVMEVSNPGTSVVRVQAFDKDEGNNSMILYSLVDTPDTHSSWFQIDPRSGLVTTKAHVDCETNPVPQLTVVATDSGFPPLSSTAKVFVTIHDVNDNEPIFDQSFYNGSVAENEPIGRCILKVSATDPDCGINAMVNYTLDQSFGNLKEFEVRSATGEVCIANDLDYETRSIYEFPVIATDRGGLSTTAMIKIQVTDTNDNRPIFYPREYNVSLREGGLSASSSTPVVIVAASDKDSGKFGYLTYKITEGNEAGIFRIDRNTGEIFITRPSMLSSRAKGYHRLNISASDGGGLKSELDAGVFISIIDSTQKPPIFDYSRYTFSVKEDVKRNTVIGSVKANIGDSGPNHHSIRYFIYSGDPNGLFMIDTVTGSIRTSSDLDHEVRPNVLLNIQATSGNPPTYGHTQVNIEIEDVNDNAPEFESSTVRISVPENAEVGSAVYVAHAGDKDSGINGIVRYAILNKAASGSLFNVDPKLGYLTLSRQLDYETAERHSLVVTASDMGSPSLSANLTVLVDVQDINDNPPVFERTEYEIKVMETLPINSQILQVTAIDLDTGNNARLTYRIKLANSTLSDTSPPFGIFPNSGWLYLMSTLDRETKDRFELSVVATDNGTPTESATTRVTVNVLDANDNDPVFDKESYELSIEENRNSGTYIGSAKATDKDLGLNAVIRYFLIPANTSFQINSITGDITSKSALDREKKDIYDLVIEARDQGTPSRNSRRQLRIHVMDVNDNAPEIVDPQEDVISVREEQPPGTEVVRIRAVDADYGENCTITYALLKTVDSDGYGVFTIDSKTGIVRTKITLDHEEKTIYRIAVSATDNGKPTKQTTRTLRIEVLDLNDNRPTFKSSSLVFRVREDVKVGHVVGSVATTYSQENSNLVMSSFGQITYTLTSLMQQDVLPDAFEIDRSSGSLVVSRTLDREMQSEYRLEVRALDTSATNNPQSSAVTVRVDISDANDNSPHWPQDPITIYINENVPIGSSIYNFTATDADSGLNSELRYKLIKKFPDMTHFVLDPLTGSLMTLEILDFETVDEYVLIIQATDQSLNVSERLSASVTARIVLKDVNDNAPIIVLPHSKIFYLDPSISVGLPIGNILATDKDSDENARVTYVIAQGNEQGYFALGYDTGVLTLAKNIDNNLSNDLVINVTASDHGTPSKHSHVSIKISRQQFANISPRFDSDYYKTEIAEDVTPGAYVAKILSKAKNSEHSPNLTFFIPQGIADDTFNIDAKTGIVSTAKTLDRESMSEYIIPIYISDSKNSYDTAKLKVSVSDVNDHSPEFHAGACYPISVPENNSPSIIHTVVAIDPDSGANGKIYYSISSGNIGNMFSINPVSGEITAKSLDREAMSRYNLNILAQDKGTPPLQSTCNIQIRVEDVNDNDPKFERDYYSARINEDIPVDTSILQVKANDNDAGYNAKIIYTLSNESQWLFRIDNKTGIVTTAGHFDRERQSEYNFQVVATDNGKSNARFQRVPVKVIVDDVNDNQPRFSKYPFKEKINAYIQPGQSVVKVVATDDDEGNNADILYSLLNDDYGKFAINPNTGVIRATQSLASENGKIIHINVVATDKGNPPKSSNGLVEITVGDLPENSPKLLFQNATYRVSLLENTEQYAKVAQVSAVRTDGRRQRIFYSLGSGNDGNGFLIDAESGTIQVKNPQYLDYELRKEIKLVVSARTEGYPTLYGYCEVIVHLSDQNDNAPKFTQQQYTASVFEGEVKGSYVLRTIANDDDEGKNSMIRYHIVDGNHDNAFKIEPEFSGILKTNIVLDREIRDTYRLTVIAFDEGVPHMTGSTRIQINIVDVNDNQPTFPPHSVITVPEDTEIGTVLTTVTANDVDTNPALVYSFSLDTPEHILNCFSIDRYSGKVILKRFLDYEQQQEYSLKITVSDEAHNAQTTLVIRVTDVNDNTPIFSQTSYQTTLPLDKSHHNIRSLLEILAVNASDLDSGDNARIRYSIVSASSPGFTIDSEYGTLKANLSVITSSASNYITIKAEDMGSPKQYSVTVAKVNLHGFGSTIDTEVLEGNKKELKVSIPENATIGTRILILDETNSRYYITAGNDDSKFDIIDESLVLLQTLDRESKDNYQLHLTSVGLTSKIFISVEDVNDNSPVFSQSKHSVNISESAPIGSTIITVTAKDNDQQDTVNSQIVYDITSGNDAGLFYIERENGAIKVAKKLDYDLGITEHNLVIRACDAGYNSHCCLTTLHINLKDANDNEPMFFVSEYLEFIAENEPLNTAIFTAHAIDMDKGVYGNLNYSIASMQSNNYPVDDAWKLFNIDKDSGLVTTNAIFDYEMRNRYMFLIKAMDIDGKFTVVKVRIEIESKDEFYPHFTERTYKFALPTMGVQYLPSGLVVGQIIATDRDKGPDGRVVYQLTSQNPYFKINRTTGAILIKKKVEISNIGHDISLVVTASSGKQNSLTNMTVVEVVLDETGDIGINLAINNKTVAATNGGIADWALGLLIAIILLFLIFGTLLVFLHMKNKRSKKVNKPNLGPEPSVTPNNYVDPSAFDTIPIRGTSTNSQFAPPKYDEIPPYAAAASSNSGAATTSELSGSEQSGSSGRGSAEDGDDNDDEEIRMINEGPLQRESGMMNRQKGDEDNLSNTSVRNTQEYLARLGIVNSNSAAPQTSRINQVPLDSLIFDEDANGDNDIANFYAKLNDVANSDRASSTEDAVGVGMEHMMNMGVYNQLPTHQPSMNGSLSSIVHSEEELAGSYNWDYLLDWGPQYQPLAHVFSEIARLKDDTASVQSGASGSSAKSKGSQMKTVPPPLITGVAPRTIPVLNASRNSSSHHLNQMNQLHPRSPINHDVGQYNNSAIMSPSFSPSLSPLATKSPSISPMVTPGISTAIHIRQAPPRSKLESDLKI